MSNTDEKIEIIRKAINTYPDFPKPGILFKDIFSVLNNPSTFLILHELIIEHVSNISPKVEAVTALESRGFLFGPSVALHFKIPFFPLRKKGKLPGNVKSYSYDLEYGQDTLEIQIDNLKTGSRVLIIDDLLATGGSLSAACALLKSIGLEIAECLVVMELLKLSGRQKIDSPIHAIVQY